MIDLAENKLHDDWNRRAYAALKVFVTCQKAPFTGKEFRQYAEGLGLPSPPSNNAWGRLMLKAVRDKLITHAGHSEASGASARSHWMAV